MIRMQVRAAKAMISLQELNPYLYEKNTIKIPPSILERNFPSSPGDPLFPYLIQEASLLSQAMPKDWKIKQVSLGIVPEESRVSTKDPIILKLRRVFSVQHPFIQQSDLGMYQGSRTITSTQETPFEFNELSKHFPPGSLSTIRRLQSFCLLRFAKVIPKEAISDWSIKHKVCLMNEETEPSLDYLHKLANQYNQGENQNNPTINACKVIRRMHCAEENAPLTEIEANYLKKLANRCAIDLNTAHAVLQIICLKRVSESSLQSFLQLHKIPTVENSTVELMNVLMAEIQAQEEILVKQYIQRINADSEAKSMEALQHFVQQAS